MKAFVIFATKIVLESFSTNIMKKFHLKKNIDNFQCEICEIFQEKNHDCELNVVFSCEFFHLSLGTS